MNKLIKEVYELSNTKDIDIRYEIQLHIAHKFIIIMDYYNKKHFVQHFLQLIRSQQCIEFYNIIELRSFKKWMASNIFNFLNVCIYKQL